MKELVNDEIKSLEKQADDLWDECRNIRHKICEKKKELLNLDFEDKYIKYDDGCGNVIYMKVETCMTDNTRYTNFDFCYLLRGLGFSGEFSGYGDATSFDWSYWYEFFIYGDEKEFLEKVNKIMIITKAEFDNEFEKCLNKVKEYHYDNKYNKESV